MRSNGHGVRTEVSKAAAPTGNEDLAARQGQWLLFGRGLLEWLGGIAEPCPDSSQEPASTSRALGQTSR